jgi:hypothetical protein
LETVARYLEAIHDINTAQKELDQIIKAVEKAARILPDRWASVSIMATKEPFIPDLPEGEERHSISGGQWPSIGRITRALSEMHKAYDAAEAAWDEIEPEFRGRLVPPPRKFSGAEPPLEVVAQSEV